ncbi:MAG: 6,7-dimethyl-8-ribityllumazine synthase [Planctomycetia bacterium]|nr:6,7-dimethyl-8-ribityllumazine synthase [Planctomycetia bacterium]
MPNVFEGSLDAGSARWAIAVARYNEHITTRLLNGALETLRKHGAADDAVDVFWVPGAFELPTVAARAAESKRYASVICLGAVIRGETTHDQHINTAISHHFAEIGVRTGVPVMFGVLTCDTLEQALHRAGGNVGNKGSECAEAALRMATLLRQMA